MLHPPSRCRYLRVTAPDQTNHVRDEGYILQCLLRAEEARDAMKEYLALVGPAAEDYEDIKATFEV